MKRKINLQFMLIVYILPEKIPRPGSSPDRNEQALFDRHSSVLTHFIF